MAKWSKHGLRMKIFLKEQGESETEPVAVHPKYLPAAPLTGERAKKIYEEIMKEEKTNTPIIKPNLNRKRKKKVIKLELKTSNIFMLAQNNDVTQMKLLLSQRPDININSTDDFGWTPLMCASCSGAEDVVSFLLQNGADPTICDRSGNSSRSLARKKNFQNIIKMINDQKTSASVKVEMPPHKKLKESFHCEKCNENFNVSQSEHEHSMLHLFHIKGKTFPTFYGIPESNKGFQLLLREGWNREKGLGPGGSGRKYPIKANMKKDRGGIGALEQVKRVSSNEPKTQQKNRSRRSERIFERNFRLEFS